jgi:hypothetical protein
MNDFEERVVSLIADKMQLRKSRIQLSSRLAEDCGMDGDDAGEFFEIFAEQFHLDLTELGDHWHRHFVPESMPISFPKELYLASAAGALAGIALHHWVHWISDLPAAVLLLIVFCLIDLKLYAIRHPSTDPAKRPITVQDLVDAATNGKWPLEYSQEDSRLPSYYPSVVPSQY